MTPGNEKIPTVISENVIDIDGLSLKVYVLDNGQRIIDAESYERFLLMLTEPGGNE